MKHEETVNIKGERLGNSHSLFTICQMLLQSAQKMLAEILHMCYIDCEPN